MKKRVFYFGSFTVLPILFICLYSLVFYFKYGMLAPLDPKELNTFIYECLLYIYPISFITFIGNIFLLYSLYKKNMYSLIIVSKLIIIFFIVVNIICFTNLFPWFID